MAHGDPQLNFDIIYGLVAIVGALVTMIGYLWRDDHRRLDGKADRDDLNRLDHDHRSDLKDIWKQLNDLNNYIRDYFKGR